MSKKKEIVMSGMRTTQSLHIGNYFGALKNWLKLQDSYECFFGAMDWHALTDAYKNSSEINGFTKEIIAEWLAWGIDHEKHTVYVQSMVPEHIELNMILSNITPMGWLQRVTTWKDAEEELKAKDAFNLGRFGYPVLQTADIALYKGTHVPVGKDQVAHLELSREIIRRLNSLYKLKIPEPEAILSEVPVLVGTDGRKMSKSYGNVFPLTCEQKKLKKLCNKMLTDSKRATREDVGNPEDCSVYTYHKLYSNQEDLDWVVTGCTTAGIGCGDCKGRLATNIDSLMEGPRERKKELLNNHKQLGDIIHAGCEKAGKVAGETLREIKDAMGFKRIGQ